MGKHKPDPNKKDRPLFGPFMAMTVYDFTSRGPVARTVWVSIHPEERKNKPTKEAAAG